MLVKVRALLAKAESTDFEEEAVALTAKAQELMARSAIDQAMVSGGDSSEAPRGRRVGIDDPYALGRANLLAAVARANRCRSVWMDRYGFTTVFGFPSDLDIVDVLYTSLLVQAVRAMTAAGKRAGRSPDGRAPGRSANRFSSRSRDALANACRRRRPWRPRRRQLFMAARSSPCSPGGARR